VYLIDTNIFLEVLLGRKNKDECISLFRMIERGEVKAFTTSFVIHSIEVIMDNFKKINELRIFLEVIAEFKGLEIYSTDIKDEISAIDMMKGGLDFDDALQSYIATKLGAKIISFDKHFDKVRGLERLIPKDIVKNSNEL